MPTDFDTLKTQDTGGRATVKLGPFFPLVRRLGVSWRNVVLCLPQVLLNGLHFTRTLNFIRISFCLDSLCQHPSAPILPQTCSWAYVQGVWLWVPDFDLKFCVRASLLYVTWGPLFQQVGELERPTTHRCPCWRHIPARGPQSSLHLERLNRQCPTRF